VLDARPVEPVPMNTRLGRLQARLAAFLFTLAGPYAYGPIYKLGHLVQPISVHESPEGNSSG
jgi:hypothetical protein